MSKKRRENQEQRKPIELTWRHYAVGAGVIIVSAVAAILIFTLVVGTRFGDDKSPADKIPPLGAATPAERSAAADILANKSWGDMTQEDRDLVRTEVNRVFDDAQFRASSPRVTGIDIFRSHGQTRVARQYTLLKDPAPNQAYAESLSFYCPEASGSFHHLKYLKLPASTEVSDDVVVPTTLPWGVIVSSLRWDDEVVDIGFDTVNGRRVHGLRFHYANSSEGAALLTNYWWDVENARLLARQDYAEGQDTAGSRYTLEWKALPPIQIPDDQERPDCVNDVYTEFTTG